MLMKNQETGWYKRDAEPKLEGGDCFVIALLNCLKSLGDYSLSHEDIYKSWLEFQSDPGNKKQLLPKVIEMLTGGKYSCHFFFNSNERDEVFSPEVREYMKRVPDGIYSSQDPFIGIRDTKSESVFHAIASVMENGKRKFIDDDGSEVLKNPEYFRAAVPLEKIT
jgi:hypothetical protein